MTPEELKKMALEATKKEYEEIMAKMQNAAKEGSFSCNFSSISDGAREQLTSAGFTVTRRYKQGNALGSSSTGYYEVSFSK
jgi:hypothetical protein